MTICLNLSYWFSLRAIVPHGVDIPGDGVATPDDKSLGTIKRWDNPHREA